MASKKGVAGPGYVRRSPEANSGDYSPKKRNGKRGDWQTSV